MKALEEEGGVGRLEMTRREEEEEAMELRLEVEVEGREEGIR